MREKKTGKLAVARLTVDLDRKIAAFCAANGGISRSAAVRYALQKFFDVDVNKKL